MNLKTKKYLSGAVFFLLTIGAFFISYLFLNNKHQSNQRTPSSFTLYTSEIESRSKKMIEESRRLHLIEDYQSANKTLSELLDKYPYAGYMEEASFLLAKGLFYEEQFNRSEQVIERLQEYDPRSRSKWLGYSLLIMGKIHEQRGEKDDSIRLYRKVITEFSDKALVDEAEDILMEVSL